MLADLIKKSNENNRIPLIMSSKQCNKKMGDVMNEVVGNMPNRGRGKGVRHNCSLIWLSST